MITPLYHGMTDAQFQEHYQNGPQIPNNWTIGPIQAFFYAFNYHKGDRSGMLIWVMPQWNDTHFRKSPERIMGKSLGGVADSPVPFWYSCTLNPFDSQQERDKGVRLYRESDLEVYIETYVKKKASRQILLELVRPKNAE